MDFFDPSSFVASSSASSDVYDRIGCSYNAPASYATINGTFTSCKGDNQLPAGIYVDGPTTKTFVQPPESLGPIA